MKKMLEFANEHHVSENNRTARVRAVCFSGHLASGARRSVHRLMRTRRARLDNTVQQKKTESAFTGFNFHRKSQYIPEYDSYPRG